MTEVVLSSADDRLGTIFGIHIGCQSKDKKKCPHCLQFPGRKSEVAAVLRKEGIAEYISGVLKIGYHLTGEGEKPHIGLTG